MSSACSPKTCTCVACLAPTVVTNNIQTLRAAVTTSHTRRRMKCSLHTARPAPEVRMRWRWWRAASPGALLRQNVLCGYSQSAASPFTLEESAGLERSIVRDAATVYPIRGKITQPGNLSNRDLVKRGRHTDRREVALWRWFVCVCVTYDVYISMRTKKGNENRTLIFNGDISNYFCTLIPRCF